MPALQGGESDALQDSRCGRAETLARPHPAAIPHDKNIGQALGIRAFGLYQVELPPGGESVRHDHADDEAEDVYAIVHGSGTIVVDGEQVLVQPGQFIAVMPDLARQVRASDSGLVFIAVCAAQA